MIATHRPLRVLVVDDCEDTAVSCGDLLRLYGHECRTALSGGEALAALGWWEPDAALIDLRMPGMSGCELARLVRARSAGEPLLVAVTGLSGAAQKREAREAGFDRFLVKPVNPDVLTGLLRALAASLETRRRD
jgi:CheY-like chemotaxis protein